MESARKIVCCALTFHHQTRIPAQAKEVLLPQRLEEVGAVQVAFQEPAGQEGDGVQADHPVPVELPEIAGALRKVSLNTVA